jgi:hypothetical protein
MKGTIYHTNISRSMYSVQLSNGSFTVFELIDPLELSRNIEVTGELEGYGDKEVTINQDDHLHIHIDHHGLSEVVAFRKTYLIE